MADAPTPAPTPVSFADALAKGITFKVEGSLPGEAVATALINYAAQVRASMDPALLKRLDAVTVQQVEDLQRVWRGIWQKLGVIQ